ncbi:siphovirus Gp157 family protein [Roseococcus pinisoli]|uniref:Siphovirus Gp157 family protein n=1 Tax=Roseococcus pinisoli TaxID=2835040 RepID=A0ABS5QCM7_9PROT|nr:siphovirus Gp157 family protein [Roseococcus pinisoli]MBS7811178.1 siphovirus Gp157 family protein [Roseococcus pinisoli]
MTDHAAPIRGPLSAIMLDADLPRALRILAADAHDAQEVEATLLRAGRALVAIESFAARPDALAKQVREALLSVMADLGAPSFSTGTHTIGYSETARVRITDPALLPERFLVPQPPKPDTAAIKAALDAGETVPGAVISNSSPSLFVRSRKA